VCTCILMSASQSSRLESEVESEVTRLVQAYASTGLNRSSKFGDYLHEKDRTQYYFTSATTDEALDEIVNFLDPSEFGLQADTAQTFAVGSIVRTKLHDDGVYFLPWFATSNVHPDDDFEGSTETRELSHTLKVVEKLMDKTAALVVFILLCRPQQRNASANQRLKHTFIVMKHKDNDSFQFFDADGDFHKSKYAPWDGTKESLPPVRRARQAGQGICMNLDEMLKTAGFKERALCLDYCIAALVLLMNLEPKTILTIGNLDRPDGFQRYFDCIHGPLLDRYFVTINTMLELQVVPFTRTLKKYNYLIVNNKSMELRIAYEDASTPAKPLRLRTVPMKQGGKSTKKMGKKMVSLQDDWYIIGPMPEQEAGGAGPLEEQGQEQEGDDATTKFQDLLEAIKKATKDAKRNRDENLQKLIVRVLDEICDTLLSLLPFGNVQCLGSPPTFCEQISEQSVDEYLDTFTRWKDNDVRQKAWNESRLNYIKRLYSELPWLQARADTECESIDEESKKKRKRKESNDNNKKSKRKQKKERTPDRQVQLAIKDRKANLEERRRVDFLSHAISVFHCKQKKGVAIADPLKPQAELSQESELSIVDNHNVVWELKVGKSSICPYNCDASVVSISFYLILVYLSRFYLSIYLSIYQISIYLSIFREKNCVKIQ